MKLIRTLKDMLWVICKDLLRFFRAFTEQVGVVGLVTNGTRCKIFKMKHKGSVSIVHSLDYEMPTQSGQIYELSNFIRGVMSASTFLETTQQSSTDPWLR